MEIINLTPHGISVFAGARIIRSYPASGKVARAQSTYVRGEATVDGVPLVHVDFGDPVDLPEYAEGTYYIVSLITAQAAQAAGRCTNDLLITAEPVRNGDGQIIGCQAFTQV